MPGERELIPKRFRVVLQAVCEGLLADHPSLESSLRLLMSQQTSGGGFKDAAVSVDSGKTINVINIHSNTSGISPLYTPQGGK